MKDLSNEQRRLYTEQALSNLITAGGLTDDDRKTYENYQTYQSIRQILSKIPQPVRDSLDTLARRAHTRVGETENYVNQFREEIALWFDRSMDRASGVYKRNAKGVAIIIGLFLAIITNSDSFFIADRLSSDENLRKVVTDRAAQITANSARPLTEKDLEDLKVSTDAALRDLTLPIGWDPPNLIRQFRCKASTLSQGNPVSPGEPAAPPSRIAETNDLRQACLGAKAPQDVPAALQLVFTKPTETLRRIMGWLVTGIAISMGAPFWFDLLGKIMNVRNTGSKPTPAHDVEDPK